jgi:hypothetical protein
MVGHSSSMLEYRPPGRRLIAARKVSRALSIELPAHSMRSTRWPSLVHFSTLQKLRWSASSGSVVSRWKSTSSGFGTFSHQT